MIRIRLTEEDRERLGVPEWIEFEVGRPKLSEIRAVKTHVGWDWTQFEKQLDSEDMDERTASRAVLWWLAVNRHTPVSWEEFDLDVFGVEFEGVDDPNLSAPNGAAKPRRTSRRSLTSSG